MRITDVVAHVLLDPGLRRRGDELEPGRPWSSRSHGRGDHRVRRDRPERMDRPRVHRGARDAHDGSRPPRDASASRSTRPLYALGRAVRRDRDDRPARSGRPRTRRRRHRTLGHRRQGGRDARLAAARREQRASALRRTRRSCRRRRVEPTSSARPWSTRRSGRRSLDSARPSSRSYHRPVCPLRARLRRPRSSSRRSPGPPGGRPRLRDHGRRRLCLAHSRRGARDHRALGRVRRLLRRDAVVAGRPRRVRETGTAITHPDRGRRMARNPLRVPRPHGPRGRPGRPAGRRPRRRAHGGTSGLPARRPSATVLDRATRLEDRDHRGRDRASGGDRTARAVLRVRSSAGRRVAAATRARRRRAHAGGRDAPAAVACRARCRAPGTCSTSSSRQPSACVADAPIERTGSWHRFPTST